MNDLGVGLVGCGFVATIHVAAFAHVPEAAVLAVAGSSEESARRFAERHEVPNSYGDFRCVIEHPDVGVVCVAVPNHLHRDVVVAAAEAGKHVICEKPLARTLVEADEMIAACDKAGVLLMYAEELCFAPKYVRAKALVDEGALGSVYSVVQGEQHFGPHSDWFWDIAKSGGGVLMDMGCHGIEFARWIYDKPAADSVIAELGTIVHSERTRGEDHAAVVVRFTGDRFGLIQTSWAKPGGMEDRAEIVGSGGVTYVDLLRGTSLVTYSTRGYGYAVEKAPDTRGWTFTMFDEIWNYGFPQEMRHFVDCCLSGTEPLETGRDGRAVLEIIYAMYAAAGSGRRVSLPFQPGKAARAEAPVQLWLKRSA